MDYLSLRTRQIVDALLAGQVVKVGGSSYGPFTAEEATLLRIVATELHALPRGADLVAFLSQRFKPEPLIAIRAAVGASPNPSAWRIARVRSSSFRGLAPAGAIWEHTFAGQSTLLHGPNGSGKSSLTGAIAWCLTGCLFRDDCEPAEACDVAVYDVSAGRPLARTRPDALALMDAAGATASGSLAFWVALELMPTSTSGMQLVWIRRHSADGLAMSTDGEHWTPIRTLAECGINANDAELQVTLPARLQHLRFGKNPDMIRLFAQIVGLDDLHEIAEAAKGAHAALARACNAKDSEISRHQADLAENLKQLRETWPESLSNEPAFTAVIPPDATSTQIADFGKGVNAHIDGVIGELAADLGLEVPPTDSETYKAFQKSMETLPGHVETSINVLAQAADALFPRSLGRDIPGRARLAELETGLAELEKAARGQAYARLEWERQSNTDTKLPLFLEAVHHHPAGGTTCPLCEQSLSPVPRIPEKLERLRSKASQPELRKAIPDLERELIAKIDALVPAASRANVSIHLGALIREEWNAIKTSAFPGPLAKVASRFNDHIEGIASAFPASQGQPYEKCSEGYGDIAGGAFADLDTALQDVHRYLCYCNTVHRNVVELKERLEACLGTVQASRGQGSLYATIERGRNNNDRLKLLLASRGSLRKAYEAQKKIESLTKEVTALRAIEKASLGSKDLGEAARREAFAAVRSVEPEMKRLYSMLYDHEVLRLDTLTPGHAANPDVRTEINAYYRAGSELVPIGPFSNAGRLRAVMLCFGFALMGKSARSLAVVLLDDPAVSLDDEHKARFVDHLIQPLLTSMQVIVATHYENFFKVAGPVFGSYPAFSLVPRRRPADHVTFEPADLLERLSDAIDRRGCTWREAGNNLRRWAERSLNTLSAYAPEPFAIFNNLPGTVDAYERITDPGMATPQRANIVRALRDPRFVRVQHRCAHDEDPTETEVRDGLTCLRGCRNDVREEIERLKRLYRHSLTARGRTAGPSIAPAETVLTLPAWQLPVVGRAAAASGGSGIEISWQDTDALSMTSLPAALARCDTLSPMAEPGHYLLLDPADTPPRDTDLVAVETEDGCRYMRRWWSGSPTVQLQAENPTRPQRPVLIDHGVLKCRRIIGVIYEGPNGVKLGKDGEEWVPIERSPLKQPEQIRAVRVQGFSLEPIARDGQLLLVRESDADAVQSGMLAVVTTDEHGTLVKRCYPGAKEWILCPTNPVAALAPLAIPTSEIEHVYKLVGVMFETPTDD